CLDCLPRKRNIVRPLLCLSKCSTESGPRPLRMKNKSISLVAVTTSSPAATFVDTSCWL
ncbi:unnamed protein product, partial [Brassica rapa subsp. trilocularis]